MGVKRKVRTLQRQWLPAEQIRHTALLPRSERNDPELRATARLTGSAYRQAGFSHSDHAARGVDMRAPPVLLIEEGDRPGAAMAILLSCVCT